MADVDRRADASWGCMICMWSLGGKMVPFRGLPDMPVQYAPG